MSTKVGNGASPEVKAAWEQYEAGMKFFAQQKFDKAKAHLEKAGAGAAPELADRARLHLAICRQRLEASAPNLRTGEDHYNYAVLQMNQGGYQEAEEHFRRALKMEAKTGHVEYALATLYGLQNDLEQSLEHLRAAIKLDSRYRVMARNDEDFKLFTDDPRFTEELYPEPA